jgi:uncharacterized protein
MQETLRALKSLQELDQQIFKLREELRRLPEERAQRRAQIDAAIARQEQAGKGVRELRARVKEIEDATTISRQRMRKVEHEAAGSRSDMALLAAYQHEIKSLKRSISVAEEEGLQLVEQVERAEADAARMKAEIATAEQVHLEFSANVERELAEAQERLQELLAARERRLSSVISVESMQLYDRLVSARGGVALAELEGRICQACFMEVPTNLYVRVARAAALAQCPSCDRILYLRE